MFNDSTADFDMADKTTPIQWPEAPAGGYFILVDFDQTAGHEMTLSAARATARKMADAEILPSTFSIATDDGEHVENVERSDGKSLSEMITDFGRNRSTVGA